jgi:hypothetical protein
VNDTTNAALIAAPQTALAETATSAQAAQAQAQVLARYAMAERHPRNMFDVEERLNRECQRPRFAAQARYCIPYSGTNVTGLSIRFAEAAARIMGNIDLDIRVVWDDDEKRVISVKATDLETNTSYGGDIVIEKVVERRKLRQGMKPIRTRVNSYGDRLHIVPATEQEVRNKAGAEVSKFMRDNILRLLPADIKDACLEQIEMTQTKADAEDPDAAAKAIAKGFKGLGISAAQLEELLGHSLEGTAPAELAKLRGWYKALQDNVVDWNTLLEAVAGKVPTDGEDDPLAEQRRGITQRVEEQISKMRGKQRGRTKAEKPPAKAPPPREMGDDSDLEPPEAP